MTYTARRILICHTHNLMYAADGDGLLSTVTINLPDGNVVTGAGDRAAAQVHMNTLRPCIVAEAHLIQA